MKEKWIIDAEKKAYIQAEIFIDSLMEKADSLNVDRKWFVEVALRHFNNELKKMDI